VTLVVGVDSSTQSCKVIVCDADTGRVVREGRAPHPDGTEVSPAVWWSALKDAIAEAGGTEDVAAISVAGQQHGMVCIDDAGEVVRPAILWNDTRSAGAARALVSELGGPSQWASAVGSVPVASFTVTKLRWLAEHEPESMRHTETVCLPHDWLTWQLRGGRGTPTTDRGDASGTGYWSPFTGDYRTDLVELAAGRLVQLPTVLAPTATAGCTRDGVVLAPGTGDNMGAALGAGTAPGDVLVSLGTSGTAFAVTKEATADPSGLVAGFADATGCFLPLVCTLNATRVLDSVARILGVDLHTLTQLALDAPPGADGLVLLPYFDGERTPDRPNASGTLHGMTRYNTTRAHLARAAIEGMLCGLADGVDALRTVGVTPQRIRLVGGGARSSAIRSIAAALMGLPVIVPSPGEYVALGAARQAAWVLRGGDAPPDWEPVGESQTEADPTPGIRERYTELRDRTEGWSRPVEA